MVRGSRWLSSYAVVALTHNPKITKVKKIQVLLQVSLLLLATHSAFAEDPIDTGVTIRAAALRADPTPASAAVKEFAANTPVMVFERQRLWVRVASADDTTTTGWLRFTELRFGTGVTSASTAPKSSGFAGFSRSVSGFLSGFRGGSSRTANTTATIGIRGLTVAELQAAQPDTNALATISRYSISAAEAEQFAGAGGLAAQHVPVGGGQ